jgi:hypothetical protein
VLPVAVTVIPPVFAQLPELVVVVVITIVFPWQASGGGGGGGVVHHLHHLTCYRIPCKIKQTYKAVVLMKIS